MRILDDKLADLNDDVHWGLQRTDSPVSKFEHLRVRISSVSDTFMFLFPRQLSADRLLHFALPICLLSNEKSHENHLNYLTKGVLPATRLHGGCGMQFASSCFYTVKYPEIWHFWPTVGDLGIHFGSNMITLYISLLPAAGPPHSTHCGSLLPQHHHHPSGEMIGHACPKTMGPALSQQGQSQLGSNPSPLFGPGAEQFPQYYSFGRLWWAALIPILQFSKIIGSGLMELNQKSDHSVPTCTIALMHLRMIFTHPINSVHSCRVHIHAYFCTLANSRPLCSGNLLRIP